MASASVSLSSCPGFFSVMDYDPKPNKHFPLQVAFDLCFIISTEMHSRTEMLGFFGMVVGIRSDVSFRTNALLAVRNRYYKGKKRWEEAIED